MFESNYGIEKMALYHGESIRESRESRERRPGRTKRPGTARKDRTMMISLINGTLTFNGVVYGLGERR